MNFVVRLLSNENSDIRSAIKP